MHTLQEYRALLGRHLGAYHTGSANQADSDTRSLVDHRLITSFDYSKHFEEWWLVRPQQALNDSSYPLDHCCQVKGLTPEEGRLLAALPDAVEWNTPPSDGEGYELFGPTFHPLVDLGAFINSALRNIMVLTELTPILEYGAYRTHLSYDVLPIQLIAVGTYPFGGSRAAADPYTQSTEATIEVINGETWLMHPGITYDPSSVNLVVLGLMPAYISCRNGTFGDPQEGLYFDNDKAIPPPEWVAAGAMMEAWSSPALRQSDTRPSLDQQQATDLFARFQRVEVERAFGHAEQLLVPPMQGLPSANYYYSER